MLVKVLEERTGRVTEVMIRDGGYSSEAVTAAGYDWRQYNMYVTKVHVCEATPLRPGDVLILRPYRY